MRKVIPTSSQNVEQESMYLMTVHRGEVQIALELSDSLEDASIRGRAGALFFGEGCEFKVWECRTVEPKFSHPGGYA